MKWNSVLILDNIRSAHNVGAIFRTADAVGISKIYLVGITPAPLDRFGRVRSDVAKASLGSEKSVKWESVKTLSPLFKKLKKIGYILVAIEQSKKSLDYKKIKLRGDTAFVVGNEVEGISRKALSACDIVAEIPMAGVKESLNVSVATGIALFRILNR